MAERRPAGDDRDSAGLARVPRDVAVQLFRRTPEGIRFLMLHRQPERGGFWQGVTGAPLAGESDVEAAIRETREETGYDVSNGLLELGTRYAYALRPGAAVRWAALYGPGVTSIPVVSFAAEVVAPPSPILDPVEHDEFAWCTFETALALLDWPVEVDALQGRRDALTELLHAVVRRQVPPGAGPQVSSAPGACSSSPPRPAHRRL